MVIDNHRLDSDFTCVPIDVLFLFQDPVQDSCTASTPHTSLVFGSVTISEPFLVFHDPDSFEEYVLGQDKEAKWLSVRPYKKL